MASSSIANLTNPKLLPRNFAFLGWDIAIDNFTKFLKDVVDPDFPNIRWEVINENGVELALNLYLSTPCISPLSCLLLFHS